MDIKQMSADAAMYAQIIYDRFGYDPKTCGVAAKFIVLASEALAACERKLNAEGKTLSEKGIDFVLAEVVKHMNEHHAEKGGE